MSATARVVRATDHLLVTMLATAIARRTAV
jgi:hypothetical protein